MSAPRASASSLSQLDRQLRQKPARFIRSMFWTSVRERRCSTRRRKTAASSSVLVLSSIVMTVISPFCAKPLDILILGGRRHRFYHIAAQTGHEQVGFRPPARPKCHPSPLTALLREIVNHL